MGNVLVTGGTGFIGSHLVKELCERHKVVVLVRDAVPSKWLTEALRNCVQVRGDILDQNLLRRLIAEYDIDQVYHMAAQAVVSVAQKDPFGTFQTNVLGTVNLLEACRQTDVGKLFVLSTDKTYGERLDAEEEDPLVSSGIYETSKATQDLATQAYVNTYGLNIVIGRSCNVYGYDRASRIVSNTIRRALKGEAPIIYEGEEETVREYIYVSDLVGAIKFLMEKQEKGIFNIATDTILSQEMVVRKICNYFPLTPRLVKREKPIKEIQKQSLNWDKLKALGWRPRYTFEQGIQETIKKFQEYGF